MNWTSISHQTSRCNWIRTCQAQLANLSPIFNSGLGLARAGVAQDSVLNTDWTTGVRSQAEAKDFSSSLCVQTSSEVHPASYLMGTGGPFPVPDADHLPTSSD
jgi:hypothetical protein